MNWNNTQFDNFEPITLKAARKVASIFNYMNQQIRFSRSIALHVRRTSPSLSAVVSDQNSNVN